MLFNKFNKLPIYLLILVYSCKKKKSILITNKDLVVEASFNLHRTNLAL